MPIKISVIKFFSTYLLPKILKKASAEKVTNLTGTSISHICEHEKKSSKIISTKYLPLIRVPPHVSLSFFIIKTCGAYFPFFTEVYHSRYIPQARYLNAVVNSAGESSFRLKKGKKYTKKFGTIKVIYIHMIVFVFDNNKATEEKKKKFFFFH